MKVTKAVRREFLAELLGTFTLTVSIIINFKIYLMSLMLINFFIQILFLFICTFNYLFSFIFGLVFSASVYQLMQ